MADMFLKVDVIFLKEGGVVYVVVFSPRVIMHRELQARQVRLDSKICVYYVTRKSQFRSQLRDESFYASHSAGRFRLDSRR